MQLLHELLFCLAGIPGQVFLFEATGKRRCRLALEVASVLHPAEAESLERLAQLGIVYKRLQELLLELSPRGAYGESLAAGIQEILKEYTRLIVHVEEGLLSDSTPSLALLETHFSMVCLMITGH